MKWQIICTADEREVLYLYEYEDMDNTPCSLMLTPEEAGKHLLVRRKIFDSPETAKDHLEILCLRNTKGYSLVYRGRQYEVVPL